MKHKHLTLSDHIEIELDIVQGSSFREIVAIIEKYPSTVINATIRMHTFGNLKMYKIDSSVIMTLR